MLCRLPLRWSELLLLYASAFAVAFWLASSLASVDRRALHRRWRLALLVVWERSLCKPLVCQPLASRTINEAIKPRQSMVLDVSFIQPEGKFVNITAKMLFARMVIDTDQTALENGENALDSVRGNGTSDVLTGAVIDRFVSEGTGFDPVISPGFIRVEHRTGFDTLGDDILDGFFVGVGNRNCNRATAALAQTKNRRFANGPAPGFELLRFVLVLFDAADKGFIDFNNAFELREIGAATRLAEPVQDEPSRLLRNADFLGELHRRNALAGRYKQVHSIDPLVQRNVAAFEDRSGAHRKVFLALIAAVEAASPRCNAVAHAANRAPRSIWPQPPFKIRPRGLLVREHLEKLEGRNGRLGHRATPCL
jgi:hypothetical protein